MGVQASYAKPVELKTLIEAALQNNTQVLKGQAEQLLASEQVVLEKKHWTPNMQLSVHGDMEKSHQPGFEENRQSVGLTPTVSWQTWVGSKVQVQATQNATQGTTPDKSTQWQISLEQPLLKGASIEVKRNRLFQARVQEKRIAQQQKQTQGQIIFEVMQKYANLHTAWQAYELQRQRLDTQLHMTEIIQQKIEMGRMAELDGLRHALTVERLKQNMAQTKQAIKRQFMGLSATVGFVLEPEQLRPFSVPQTTHPLEASYEAAENFYLKPLEWERQILKKEAHSIEDSEKWDLHLKGVYSRGRRHYHLESGGVRFNPEVDDHTHSRRYLGLFLSIPLTQDPQLDLAKYQNKTAQYKNALDYKEKTFNLKQQISQAHEDIQYWQIQKALSEKAYGLAQKTLEIEKQKYLVGRASALDWENAQASELQAALDEVYAQRSLFLAHAQLDYLTGLLPQRWSLYV